MSARSRSLPRRSCLSIPGSSAKMLAKGPGIPADMVILDLEDAVAAREKEAARATVVDAIRDHDWGDKVLCVRVNDWTSRWTAYDVVEVVGRAGERLDEVMLPKVETAAQVVAIDLLLRQVELAAGLPEGHVGLEVQIETARGLLHVEEICAASGRLEAVAFGPVDFAASVELPEPAGGVQRAGHRDDPLHHVRSGILVAGRASGLQVIDGPYPQLRDPDGLRDEAGRARSLGYDGKWAIHPDQVPILNEVFSPDQDQFDRACALLDAYRTATEDEGRGAVTFGGEMIDEATRKVALKLLARGERAGLRRSRAT